MAQETNDKSSKRKSVLIAHPYALVREGLCHLIREAGFLICDQVGNIDALFRAVSEHNPDIIIADFRITRNDASLVDKLKSKTGAVVAIVAVPEEIEQAPEALKAGAKGYLSYSQTAEEFMQSLSLLTKGSVIVSNVAGEKLQSSIQKDKVDTGGITEREREELGYKLHFMLDCSWSNEEWQFIGIEEWPSMEAIEKIEKFHEEELEVSKYGEYKTYLCTPVYDEYTQSGITNK